LISVWPNRALSPEQRGIRPTTKKPRDGGFFSSRALRGAILAFY
jgi:hypothetical protein